MSLVEAAAALDRLLRGQSEEGLSPNVPPLAPPVSFPDNSNLLPTLFSNAESPKVPQSSTPTEGTIPPIILPWENLSCALDEPPCTPFCRTFSPLPSPIPVPTPTLPALPPPLYPIHWMTPEAREPLDSEVSTPKAHSTSSKTTDDVPKRRRRRRNPRAYSESTALNGRFVPLDPKKYKTELCRSFQVHGNCRYGVRCNYAHGLKELKGASRHGKYKTRNCQSYHQTGFCRYGARCSFIHDPEEGVLKCSIANKEVLEALHYCPSKEDNPRTANITWRFLESSEESVPELHFISTTTPSQENSSIHNSSDTLEEIFFAPSRLQQQINLFISAKECDDRRLISCTFPFFGEVSTQGSTLLLQENLELLRSLQTQKDFGKTDAFVFARNSERLPETFEENLFFGNRRERSRSCPAFTNGFAFESPELTAFPVLPVEPAKVREINYDDELCENIPAASEEIKPENSLCQELMNLDTVQEILRNAPAYSSTVWSDGTDYPTTDIEKAAADTNTEQSTEEDYKIQGDSHEETKIKSLKDKDKFTLCKPRIKNTYHRNRKGWQNNRAHHGARRFSSEQCTFKPKDDRVVLSDPGDENGELDVLTGAAGVDSDWSEKSSFNLADLLHSLRSREGSNQLLAWSKSGRRYSSDGSSAGPKSTKDPHSSHSSPARPRQHDMTKYKTELCRSFQYNGYCSYGDACLYAHGSVDLRSYPKHPMYRTKQCFSFHNKGFCLYGSRCQFLHDME